jgi:hypothetical protein
MAGCDDGDMDYKTFDFSNQENPTACPVNTDTNTETYWKINGTEGLILQLPKGALINSPTLDPITGEEVPREIVLGGSNKLTYQNYVKAPTSLCIVSEIPADNETWNAQGTLSVITKEYLDPVTNKLKGYIHNITFKNVTFKLQDTDNDESITINNSSFGEIKKEFGFSFKFTAEGADAPVVDKCDPTSTLLFTRLDKQILSLDVIDFDAYFNHTSGTKTIVIPNPDGEDQAIILFNVYSGTASKQNICAQGSDVPSLPTQKWILAEGIITIIPVETGGIYSYNVYLKDAIFKSQTSADSFELNKVVTIDNPNGYFFGTYQEE